METKRPAWPELPYAAWQDTCTTLHLWTQVVGKIRLAQVPWLNHSWHATLYPTARGLGTSTVPYGDRVFQIDFDLIAHALAVRVSDGSERLLPLKPQSVASRTIMAGSILGFSRVQIDGIFDDIVEFAELQEFIDTDPFQRGVRQQ